MKPNEMKPNESNHPVVVRSANGAGAVGLPLEALEWVAGGCVVLDDRGSVLFANCEARRMLAAEDDGGFAKALGALIGRADSTETRPAEAFAEATDLEVIWRDFGSRRLVVLRRGIDPEHAEERARRLEAELIELDATAALSQELLRNNNNELNRSLELLRRMNAELAESDRLRGEFLANTRHELRTPINAILGYVQYMMDGLCESDEERDRCLRNTVSTARHLLRLIDDVLDMAKIDSGVVSLCLENQDVEPILAEVREMLAIEAERRGLDFRIEIADPSRRVVRCDADKLKRVLINLVGNALKFTHEGCVRVTLAPYPDEPDTMVFSVEDSGIGIDPSMRDKVFDKFVQGDGSSTRLYEGTGLGLTICRSLVEAMGGHIWIVKSDRGKGTTFSFTLPGEVGEPAVVRPRTAPEFKSIEELLPETF